MSNDTKPIFVGCADAVCLAEATCPDCRRKGQVGVSTDAILHKTMLCVDCAEKKQRKPIWMDYDMEDFWGFGG